MGHKGDLSDALLGTVIGASPGAPAPAHRWFHEGEAYGLSFPTLDQDLRIKTLQARIVSSLLDSFWLVADHPEMLCTLEVCLVEHPPTFQRLDGSIVSWRLLDPQAKRSDPIVGPKAGPLNRDGLEQFAYIVSAPCATCGTDVKYSPCPSCKTPFQPKMRVSALDRALQECRAFLGSFRQGFVGPPDALRADTDREAPVAGDGESDTHSG